MGIPVPDGDGDGIEFFSPSGTGPGMGMDIEIGDGDGEHDPRNSPTHYHPYYLKHQIEKNIEEAKPFVEDKDYAVKSAEDGTADLKKTVKELAKSLADYEKKLEVYVCTDKISGNEDKCLEDQLRDARVTGDEAVALEKKLDIIQKDENIEKGLKFLAYDEGRMESIQKEWMVESEVVGDYLIHIFLIGDSWMFWRQSYGGVGLSICSRFQVAEPKKKQDVLNSNLQQKQKTGEIFKPLDPVTETPLQYYTYLSLKPGNETKFVPFCCNSFGSETSRSPNFQNWDFEIQVQHAAVVVDDKLYIVGGVPYLMFSRGLRIGVGLSLFQLLEAFFAVEAGWFSPEHETGLFLPAVCISACAEKKIGPTNLQKKLLHLPDFPLMEGLVGKECAFG
ncbi:hypothetical protein Tco_0097594 [Tanacetum coccineum]